MSAPDFAAIAREWLYAMSLPDNREDSLASRLRDVHAEWTAAEREAVRKIVTKERRSRNRPGGADVLTDARTGAADRALYNVLHALAQRGTK
jgi:hypothetical protein